MAGRDDFVFPRQHQAHLAAAISNTRLHIVERASPIPHDEQTDEVLKAVREFVTADSAALGA